MPVIGKHSLRGHDKSCHYYFATIDFQRIMYFRNLSYLDVNIYASLTSNSLTVPVSDDRQQATL